MATPLDPLPAGLLWSADGGRRPRRVAIVHDWLVTYAGSERVLEELLVLYPEAEIFTLVDFLPREARGFLDGRRIHTSFLQRLPGVRRRYRHYLPLMPLAVEQFDLRGFDLVISSSHAVAKGVLTGPGQTHVCYCHSPMRYAWDLQHEYLAESGLTAGLRSWAARWLLHRMRLWDVRTANGVDAFVANSRFIARRIRKVYGRSSAVIHPPVDTRAFTPGGRREDFYLTASRFVPYKRIPLIVEAFAGMPDKALVVIGDGPDRNQVKSAAGSNVTLLGHASHEVLLDHMRRARAFVFAAEEDFGITPVEAQACGTPVLAFGRGGALETVVDGRTGILYGEQSPEALVGAVRRFEKESAWFDPRTIRRHAEGFGSERFRREMTAVVARAEAQAGGAEAVSSAERNPQIDASVGSLGRLNEDPVVASERPVSQGRPEDAADDVAVAVGSAQDVTPLPVVPELLRNPYQRRSS